MISAGEKGCFKIIEFLLSQAKFDKYDQQLIVQEAVQKWKPFSLISHFLNTDYKDFKSNITSHPVFYAARIGRLDLLQHFIEKDLIDLEMVDQKHSTVLMSAISSVNIVKYLLSLEKVKNNINNPDKDNISPLWRACYQGDVKIVKLLVEHGADVFQQNDEGTTPFMIACAVQHLSVVKYLVENTKVDLNTPTKTGMTPLFRCCSKGYFDLVEYLISKGADLSQLNLLFLLAVSRRDLKIARFLVDVGKKNETPISFDFADSGTRETALFHAFRNSDLEMIEFLVKEDKENRIDVNKENCDGVTILWEICARGDLEMLKYLINKFGNVVDLNEANNEDITPIWIASNQEFFEIVKFLVEFGKEKIDLNKPNKDGETPVKTAVSNHNFEISKFLESHGGKYDVKK